jgi:hypothetical protein
VSFHHERDAPVSLRSSITDGGLVGLEMAPALEFVDLCGCAGIVDAASIVWGAAERSVKVLVSASRLGVSELRVTTSNH